MDEVLCCCGLCAWPCAPGACAMVVPTCPNAPMLLSDHAPRPLVTTQVGSASVRSGGAPPSRGSQRRGSTRGSSRGSRGRSRAEAQQRQDEEAAGKSRLRQLQEELAQAKEARKLVEQDAQLLSNRIALLKVRG